MKNKKCSMIQKSIRVMLAGVLAVLAVFSTPMSVLAEGAPSSINLGWGENIGSLIGQTYFPTKTLTDGTYGYCLDFHAAFPQNMSMSLVGERNAGYAYIIQNGYPYKSFTGDRLKDYYITSSAVWWFMDDTEGTSNLTNNFKTTASDPHNLRPYIKQLVAGAKEAKNKGYAKPSIKASIANSNMSETSDGKYFVSEEIKVSGSNLDGKYNVAFDGNVPSGSQIINSKGTEQTSFAQNETFKIRVPKTSVDYNTKTLNVKITGSGSVEKVYEYASSDSKYQHIVPGKTYTVTQSADTSIAVKVQKDRYKIEIIKKDISNQKNLKGATLVLKDSKGKVIDTWVTTEEAHVIDKDIEPGTYTLQETKAPDGYVLNKEVKKIEIKKGETIKTVEFYNTPENTIVISKQDITNKQELPGAILIIKDAKTGKELYRWTSTDKPYTIKNLDNGKYILEEIQAPNGYILSKETIEFEIKNHKAPTEPIVMYNAPEVVVPPTDSASSIIIYVVGTALLISGIGFAYYHAKKEQQ